MTWLGSRPAPFSMSCMPATGSKQQNRSKEAVLVLPTWRVQCMELPQIETDAARTAMQTLKK